MVNVTIKQKLLNALFIHSTILLTGCGADGTANVPSDFSFIMDVKRVEDFEGCAVNVNIRIDATGGGRYETYDTDCAIEFDTNHMVTYQRSRVIEKGQFELNINELEGLWHAINQNNFFNLTIDYRMSIGYAYAFIVVKADGQHHIVYNIGKEVPEIRAIVEAIDTVMPEDVNLNYGEGFLP